MKLKEKTFILLFVTALLLTTAAGILLLRFYVSEKTEHALNDAAGELNELCRDLDGHVARSRADINTFALTDSEIKTVFNEFFSSRDEACWIVTPDNTAVGHTVQGYGDIPESSGTVVRYYDKDRAIVASTAIHLENGENVLNLYIPFDATDKVYPFVLYFMAVVISLICAFIAAAAVSAFERKLKRMHADALKMVGDRSARLKGYNEPELNGLAAAINASADSVADDMEKLQTIADGRKQFTDNLAHEMKTPLTSILGFADILRIRRSLDDRTRMEYANIIFEEARRMRGLSGKLLELATAGNTKLDFESVDIVTFFDEVRISVLPLLAPRGITLKASSVPLSLKMDRELFKSLIYNLIENAAKASPQGAEIRLVCEATAETIKISVSDNGCGMTADQIRRATEPFYMADKSRSRKAGGAGLGLALCAEIAEKHRARMMIQSKPGKGTTVTLIMLRVLAEAKGGRANEADQEP